jgi:hypothetical protein
MVSQAGVAAATAPASCAAMASRPCIFQLPATIFFLAMMLNLFFRVLPVTGAFQGKQA